MRLLLWVWLGAVQIGWLGALQIGWLGAITSASACESKPQQSSDHTPSEPSAAGDDAALAASAQKPEQIVLTGVVIKTIDPKQGAVDLMPQELARRIGGLLTSKPLFVRSADDVDADRRGREAKLEVVIEYRVDERPKDALIVCVVSAKILWADGGDDIAPAENVIAERPLSRKELRANPKGLVLEHVTATVIVTAQGIANKERLRGGSVEEVVSALTGDDPDSAIWALELVRERKLSEALDSVILALGSKIPGVRDTAIGALVALGDSRGVKALADMAEFSDHELMRMVLESVSAIGGADAVEYLEFIASGHPDEDIKQRAQEGLDRLKKNPRAAR